MWALLDASVTDTRQIPGVGRYCVIYHVVAMNYRHLGEIKGTIWFFSNLGAYSPVYSRTDD